MRTALVCVILVSLTLGALLLVREQTNVNPPGGSSQAKKIFVWIYRFQSLDNEKLAEDLRVMKIDGAFLSVSPLKLDRNSSAFDRGYAQKILEFLQLAQVQGIAVHAIAADDPSYTFSENHKTVLERVEAILRFNLEHPGSGFAGIQLDVEPFDLEEWRDQTWAGRNRLFQQYVSLLAETKRLTEERQPPIILSTTTAWWYADAAAEGSLSESLLEESNKYPDWVIPLVYDISPQKVPEIATRLEPFFNAYAVVIGLKVNDFQTYDALNEAISNFTWNLRLHRNLVGFSIFQYEQLSAAFARSSSIHVSTRLIIAAGLITDRMKPLVD